MNKVHHYRVILRGLDHWDPFLLSEARLPGKRVNLELAQAVADEGTRELCLRYAAIGPDQAPVNTPGEFLAFCGVLGVGACLADGELDVLGMLRTHASDPRWPTREAAAMALQRWGRRDKEGLIDAMRDWARGTALEQRAAAAALCVGS